MSSISSIQWTDVSSNPIHLIKEDGSHGGHWCRKTSKECDLCYAESLNNSGFFSFASHLKYEGEAPSNLIFDEDICKKWLTWKKPKKIFVCSMTDLFGEWVKDEWIDKVFGHMASARWHTFQLLTKRPERAIAYFNRSNLAQKIMESGELICKPELPLKNVWIGVTCGTQKTADERVPLLLEIPAVVRWLSVEPLLSEVDLTRAFSMFDSWGEPSSPRCNPDGTNQISWVVVGGESGAGARPLPIEWLEAIAQQCQSAGVPIFIKQLGNFPVTSNPENFPRTELIVRKDWAGWCFSEAEKIGLKLEGMHLVKLKDRKGGNIEEFPEHLKIREFPVV